MARQYRVQKNGKDFFVYEKGTDSQIMKYDNYQDANNRAHLLESGTGFQGWTPTFFNVSGLDAIQDLWVKDV